MTKKQEAALVASLRTEYKNFAVGKKYVGPHAGLTSKTGFAWRSNIMNRWCFIPRYTEFTLDNVYRVDVKNLYNL